MESWGAPVFIVVELADGYCFYMYMHMLLDYLLILEQISPTQRRIDSPRRAGGGARL